ncbi:MAG TPA: lysylphosphatidylglycerol synthase transmembrane domain-containing protein [Anaerolineales bacterium]|nr:lysylphosphatidylglycerol synthase transmembrane domain-containing protein [Anaerolineales bacterium]
MAKPHSNRSSLTRRLIPGLIFGFLVLLALLLAGDLRQVSGRLLTFHWAYYPLAILLTLVNYSLRFVKWQYYLAQIGVRDFPVLESARLFVAGFPLAVTPGKVGEALKGVWLKKQTGIPAARGVSAVLAERISDGLGVLALSTLGVIAYPRYWPAFAVVLAGLLGVIVISQIRPLALGLIGLGERLPLISRFAHLLHEFYAGSFALFRPRATLVAVALGTVSWFAEGVGLYLILIGLGASPGGDTFSISVFVMAFSTVIGAVSALPGGLGATEASLAGMLVFLLSLPAGTATAATLLIRFATLWFGVALGLVAWLFSRDLLRSGE